MVTPLSRLGGCNGSIWNWLCLAQGSLVLCSWRTPLHPTTASTWAMLPRQFACKFTTLRCMTCLHVAGSLWQQGQGSEHSSSQSHTQFAARAQQSINAPQSIIWTTWGKTLIFQSMALILTSKIKWRSHLIFFFYWIYLIMNKNPFLFCLIFIFFYFIIFYSIQKKKKSVKWKVI